MLVKSKVVVVTGSSDNIGAATARKFASEGASVVLNARKSVAAGQRTVNEITKSGGKAIFVQADVGDAKEAERLIDSALKEFGRLDILINNAGGYEHAAFMETSAEHWENVMRSNLYTAVNCSRAAVKVMPSPGGRIVNMASIRGLAGGGCSGGIAYSTSKAAVISFTQSLAQELAPDILVNAVAPGFTKTTAFDGVADEVIKSFLDSTALKRWLKPEEIADAFYFLATADGITGQVLVVDAGWSVRPC